MILNVNEKNALKIGEIFRKLAKGGVINKKITAGIDIIENPDYQFISDNEESFSFISATVGGDIKQGEGYYILSDIQGNSTDRSKKLKSKIFVMVNLMSDYSSTNNVGLGFEDITSSITINEANFIKYLSAPESFQYERAFSNIDKGLTLEKVIKELIDLGFLFRIGDGLKLSYYGQSIYKSMLENYRIKKNKIEPYFLID
jgi:hypothetical protein